MIDASKFPGPAMFQVVMFIVILLWACWLFRRPRTGREVRISLVALAALGFALMAALIALA